MKRFIISTIIFLLLLPLLGSFVVNEISADEYYPIACEIFEVSEINDDGSFSKVSCHNSYTDAKEKMKENENYVVRHKASWSPTKIIAMNSGLVYSYPQRSGDETMNLYPSVPFSDASYNSYIGLKGIEMTYIDTYSLNDSLNGMGRVQIVCNGFKGYCDLEYVDLVPTKYIEKQIPIYLGGNDKTNGNQQPYKVVCKQNYYCLKKNGNYLDLEFHYYRCYPYLSSGTEPFSVVKKYDDGSSVSFMQENVKYYSNDGINFYKNSKLTDYAGTYYPYYLFLPMRSTTNISADTLNAYLLESGYSQKSVLLNEGSTFISNQNKYGVNGLLIYAMACHESAYGTSSLAKNYNNLFGWNAIDSNVNNASKYDSISKCVEQHMGYNLRKYLDRSNALWFGSCLGTKGVGFNVEYASDPYWGYGIAAIAYDIDKFANNYNGKLTDCNKYQLGVINEINCKLYKEQSIDSQVYYYMRYRKDYFENYTVIVLDSNSNFTKIQSTNPIKNGEVKYDVTLLEYDFEESVGYVETKYVASVLKSTKLEEEIPLIENPRAITAVNSISINENTLTIDGFGAIYGINMTDANQVSHKVKIIDVQNDQNYIYDATTKDSDGFDLNDGYNYQYSSFEINIDLTLLPLSSYQIELTTTYANNTVSTILSSTNAKYRNINKKNNDIYYCLSCNSLYKYRIELDIFTSVLDYSSINKPSKRNSLATYDSINLSDDGTLIIEGNAYIYYTNFDQYLDYFELYLIDDKNNYLLLDTQTVETIDYASLFGLDYNLDYIGFSSTGNVSNLEGEYHLIMKIKNGNYIDIVEICNMSKRELPKVQINNTEFRFITSKVRNSVILKAGI